MICPQVEGRVPTGAGLSSSAALVCSSAIAVMSSMGKSFTKARAQGLSRATEEGRFSPAAAAATALWCLLPAPCSLELTGVPARYASPRAKSTPTPFRHSSVFPLCIRGLPQSEVSELACVAERYVGTQSGGMDQAISVMGQRGLAKVVHFNPVRTDDVKLPSDAAFVIANSLTVSNKAETAHTRYNLRVIECRLAAILLAKRLGVPMEKALEFKTLGEIDRMVGGLPAATAEAEKHLREGAFTASELEAEFGDFSLTALFADNATSLSVRAGYGVGMGMGVG